jgi:hypothetical protein
VSGENRYRDERRKPCRGCKLQLPRDAYDIGKGRRYALCRGCAATRPALPHQRARGRVDGIRACARCALVLPAAAYGLGPRGYRRRTCLTCEALPTKRCTTCDEPLPLAAFSKRSELLPSGARRTGYRADCNGCRKATAYVKWAPGVKRASGSGKAASPEYAPDS